MWVKTSPNSKFVNIIDIYQAQITAKKASILVEDKKENNKSDSTLDCILIE